MRKLFALLASMALVTFAAAPVAAADPKLPAAGSSHDNAPFPLGERQAQLRAAGMQALLTGGGAAAQGSNKRVRLGKAKFVELARAGRGQDLDGPRRVRHAGQSDLRRARPGPAAQPDPGSPIGRSTTRRIWAPDFNQAYYENLLFSEAARRGLDAQLLHRAVLEPLHRQWRGEDWVRSRSTRPTTAPTTAAASSARRVAVRAMTRPTPGTTPVAAGKTAAQFNAYLAQFDVWDRYDYDGDGNFNEPDGYIDHFQAVHAGEGEETGGGAQGTDAIWSHRWYAFFPAASARTAPASTRLRRRPDRRHRLLDRRLHRRAGERRRRRLRARVRPRPRPARPVRHQRQHRWRRELDRLLDAVLAGLLRHTDAADGIGSMPIDMSASRRSCSAGRTTSSSATSQKASVKLGAGDSTRSRRSSSCAAAGQERGRSNVGAPASGQLLLVLRRGNNVDNTMTAFTCRLGRSPSRPRSTTTPRRTSTTSSRVSSNGTHVDDRSPTNTDPNGRTAGNERHGSAAARGSPDGDASRLHRPTSTSASILDRRCGRGAGCRVDDVTVARIRPMAPRPMHGWTLAGGFMRTDGDRDQLVLQRLLRRVPAATWATTGR